MKKTSEDSPIRAAIGTAVRYLVNNATWHGVLAENLYWASCEGLLQATLLHAFNVSNKRFIADRERELQRAWKLDLVILERNQHDAWWLARGRVPVDRRTLASLARGLIQLKVAWTEGNASGSATIAAKAKAIKKDVEGLTSRQAIYPHCEFYWCVLVAGFHPKREGAHALNTAESVLRATLEPLQVGEQLQRLQLLDELAAPHAGRSAPKRVASASLLWGRLAASSTAMKIERSPG